MGNPVRASQQCHRGAKQQYVLTRYLAILPEELYEAVNGWNWNCHSEVLFLSSPWRREALGKPYSSLPVPEGGWQGSQQGACYRICDGRTRDNGIKLAEVGVDQVLEINSLLWGWWETGTSCPENCAQDQVEWSLRCPWPWQGHLFQPKPFYDLMWIWGNLKIANLVSQKKGLVRGKKSGPRDTLADDQGLPPASPSPALRNKYCAVARPGDLSLPLQTKSNQVIPPPLFYHFKVYYFVTNQDSPAESDQVENHKDGNHIQWKEKAMQGEKEGSTIRCMIPLCSYRKNNTCVQKYSAYIC